MSKYKGKILFLGCGSITQSVLPLLLKHLQIPPSHVTVLDFVDNREKISSFIAEGGNYAIGRLSSENYAEFLKKYLGPGDLLIDLAWNIDTCVLLDYCHQNNVLYINTSVEYWSPYRDEIKHSPKQLTLYARHMTIQKMIDGWESKKGATSVVDHGANPGLVSHFTKQALLEIGEKILTERPLDSRKRLLENALEDRAFAKIAQLAGVKVIHISERDTQITNQPKEVNEFVNTWSIEGFIEEGIAPAELGWGTHEKSVPKGAYFHETGPKNQICLSSRGMNTWVRSWVPSGEITGMVIRHGESYSLSKFLTVIEEGEVAYRPTVHYAYCPCDSAVNSMHELEMRQFVPQERRRILSKDIIKGADELGCLLMGHDFKAWWIGSVLDIQNSRKWLPQQNATTLQVAISVVAACLWIIAHPQEGFCLPEDLDHQEILKISKPYLGQFVSTPIDWSPLHKKNPHLDYGCRPIHSDNEWQFGSFLLSPMEVPAIQPVVQAF